jgi:hypothetical protein
MLELRNVLNIKYFLKNEVMHKRSEKVFLTLPLSQTSVWKNIWGRFVFGKNVDLLPDKCLLSGAEKKGDPNF